MHPRGSQASSVQWIPPPRAGDLRCRARLVPRARQPPPCAVRADRFQAHRLPGECSSNRTAPHACARVRLRACACASVRVRASVRAHARACKKHTQDAPTHARVGAHVHVQTFPRAPTRTRTRSGARAPAARLVRAAGGRAGRERRVGRAGRQCGRRARRLWLARYLRACVRACVRVCSCRQRLHRDRARSVPRLPLGTRPVPAFRHHFV
jgi:hypothetical protein